MSKLHEHELTAARPIIFGSILRTLNHVYAMGQVWKAHLQGASHDLSTRNPEICPLLDELRMVQQDIDDGYICYADSLPQADTDEIVAFTFIGGGVGVDEP